MKNLYNRKLYLRLSLWLLISFTIVVLPLSLVLSKYFSNYAISEINKFNYQNMYGSARNIDSTLERMKALSFKIYSDERTQKYLSQSEYNGGLLWEAYDGIKNYLLNEELVNSVYILNPKTNVIFDSKKGISNVNEFHDQRIIKIIKSGEYEQLKFFNHQVGNQSYLAMITLSKQFKGIVVLLLDVNKLETFLLQENQNDNVKIVLTDNNNQLLLGNEVWNDYGKQLLNRKKESDVLFEMKINNEPWAVNHANIEGYGITLYHLTKMSAWKENITTFQYRIIMFSLCLLVILFMIVLWRSKKTFQPFSNLAQQIEEKLGQRYEDKQNKKDHQILQEGFDHLIKNVKDLNHSINEHRQLIKGDYLRQWILQGDMSSAIKKYVLKETDLLSFPYLFLAVARIERYQLFTEKHDLSSRKFLKFAMGNIAEQIQIGQEITGHPIDFGGDHIVILYGIDQPNKHDYLDMFMKMKEQIKHHLELDVTIAISNPTFVEDNLRNAYDKVYKSSTLKFITGEDKIYQEIDYETYRNIINPVDDSIKDSLIQAIRLGREDRVNAILFEMFEHMKKMAYAECKFQLTYIIYSIIKSYSQLASLNSFSGVQNELGKFNSLNEVRDWMEKELKKIMENLNQRNNSDRKTELANEILEFVDLNIHDPMLTVDQIANHLSLSVNYVRQVFKEVRQETLSDYILNKRIERVTTLLKTTDWLIAEIAERSGFQTKSTFYTVFKKIVGMTPAEYRQLNQE